MYFGETECINTYFRFVQNPPAESSQIVDETAVWAAECFSFAVQLAADSPERDAIHSPARWFAARGRTEFAQQFEATSATLPANYFWFDKTGALTWDTSLVNLAWEGRALTKGWLHQNCWNAMIVASLRQSPNLEE